MSAFYERPMSHVRISFFSSAIYKHLSRKDLKKNRLIETTDTERYNESFQTRL